MEKVKKTWRRGFIDEEPRTPEELKAYVHDFWEHIQKEEAEKKAKEDAKK